MNPPTRSHKVVLSLVMLLVLGASTFAAWLLVRSRESNVERAHQILSALRQKGLRTYWGSRSETVYYVGRDASGRAVRWQISTRRPTAAGYAGMTVRGDARSPHSREQWEAANDVSSDRYEGILLLDEEGVIQTRIDLNQDVLAVQGGAGGPSVTTPRPDNYIPEGLTSLVIRLVAQGGKQAAFKMIFDEQAVVAGQIHFAQLSLRPLGKDSVQGEFSSFNFAQKTIYRLDEQGRIRQIQMEEITYDRVTRSQFLDFFPRLRNLRWEDDGGDEDEDLPAG